MDFAGDLIVKGILEEKRIFSVPGHMLFGVSLIRCVHKLISMILLKPPAHVLFCSWCISKKKKPHLSLIIYTWKKNHFFFCAQVVTRQFAKIIQQYFLRENPHGTVGRLNHQKIQTRKSVIHTRDVCRKMYYLCYLYNWFKPVLYLINGL